MLTTPEPSGMAISVGREEDEGSNAVLLFDGGVASEPDELELEGEEEEEVDVRPLPPTCAVALTGEAGGVGSLPSGVSSGVSMYPDAACVGAATAGISPPKPFRDLATTKEK